MKIRKVTFVNKRRHLVKSLFTFQLTVFRGSSFYDLLLIEYSNFFFYQPVNTDKPNFLSFLVMVGAAASFNAKVSYFEIVAKREVILIESRLKTVNIQGYSELREPIRTRENCYPLIW